MTQREINDTVKWFLTVLAVLFLWSISTSDTPGQRRYKRGIDCIEQEQYGLALPGVG